MSRRYNYHTTGSEEGVRRDIRRRRWTIILMILLGGGLIAFLVYLSVVK